MLIDQTYKSRIYENKSKVDSKINDNQPHPIIIIDNKYGIRQNACMIIIPIEKT